MVLAAGLARRTQLLTLPRSPFQSPNKKRIIKRKVLSSMATPPKRIVVCGGGVVGACTAYFLATHSAAAADVTVVEKSSPACAASGKAGGFLALDWCDGGELSSLARASFRLHASLSSSLSGATAYGYRPLHTLSISISSSSPAPSPSSSSSNLLPDWVDGGVSRPPREIGTPATTAQVHPGLFTKTLLATAEKDHGVNVVIAEVERVVTENGRATGVMLKGRDGVLPAEAVVLALGPWSSRSPLISQLFTVSGLKAQSIVLRPKEPEAITPHALSLSYQPAPGAKMLDLEVYPRPTGEVYICGMTKDEEVPDDPVTITGDRESIAMLHKIAGTVSSQLKAGEGGAGAEVVAEQACFLPCTDDGLPVIGEMPGVKGCYVATGHSCWGILNGPATGAALAELILDGRSTTVDLAPFSPARFLKRRSSHGV